MSFMATEFIVYVKKNCYKLQGIATPKQLAMTGTV